MKQNIYFIIFIFIYFNIFSQNQENQFNIAKKYADKSRTPVMILNPEDGKKIGYILYYDLDEDGEKEIIIPYKIKKTESEIENKASPYRQYLAIDIVKKQEIIRDFIKVELAYTYTPKPYIFIKRIPENELPKIFLMINNGISKEKGPDNKYELIIKSFNKEYFDIRKFETVKMPWQFILYQFSNTPTINEFYTLAKEGKGIFYIRTLKKEDRWPKIPISKIKEFSTKLHEYRKEISWEYGPISSGLKP